MILGHDVVLRARFAIPGALSVILRIPILSF
jgi:hypothetical protein